MSWVGLWGSSHSAGEPAPCQLGGTRSAVGFKLLDRGVHREAREQGGDTPGSAGACRDDKAWKEITPASRMAQEEGIHLNSK